MSWSPEPSPQPEARLDLGRRDRLGMVEAIWGEHKSAAQIAAILLELEAAEVFMPMPSVAVVLTLTG